MHSATALPFATSSRPSNSVANSLATPHISAHPQTSLPPTSPIQAPQFGIRRPTRKLTQNFPNRSASRIQNQLYSILRNPENLEDLWPTWQKIQAADIHNFSALASLLHVLGAIKEKNHQHPALTLAPKAMAQNLAPWASLATRHIHTATPQTITKLLASLNTLQQQIPSPLSQPLDNRIASLAPSLSADDVSHIIVNMAYLSHIPAPKTLAALAQIFQTHDYGRAPENLSRALYGLSIMDAIAPNNPTIQSMHEHGITRLYDVKINELSPTAHNTLNMVLQYHYQNGSLHPFIRQGIETPSSHERSLRRLFSTHCPQYLTTDRYLFELAKNVDFAFSSLTTQGKRLIIEHDGSVHFLQNGTATPIMNGKTIFQTKLLNRLYPDDTLVRIPYTWLEHLNKQDSTTIRHTLLSLLHKMDESQTPLCATLPHTHASPTLIPIFPNETKGPARTRLQPHTNHNSPRPH